MPHSQKSHNSHSHKSHSSKQSSRHSSSHRSSSSRSTHTSLEQYSHFDADPVDYDNGGLSHYKGIPIRDINAKSNPSDYADHKRHQAKETSKRNSRYTSSSRAGPSSSRHDKEERRKKQNRDSSRATDAGKRAHLNAMQDTFVAEEVHEEYLKTKLDHKRKGNRHAHDDYQTMSSKYYK